MRKVVINTFNTEKLLAETQIDIADYVINPYRGCEYGCLYCYADNNKNVLKKKYEWGEFVDVKINSIELLKKELSKKSNINKVLIGSTTEIFQPVENQFHLTENILKILKEKNIPFVILTKSTLIQKFITLLNYNKDNEIYFTVNSEIIKRLFEPISPFQEDRIEVIKKLLTHNIKVIIYISPYFPYLTNYEEIFKLISKIDNKYNIKLYFESYNIKAGNWEKVKSKLDNDMVLKYEKIYASEKEYYNYWNRVKENIKKFNKEYNYNIKFFIYPYNNFFSFFSYK